MFVVSFVFLAASPVHAQESIGYSAETVNVPARDAVCNAPVHCNHDGTFEDAYQWRGEGIAPPYYGCFAEAYNMGVGILECANFWLTQVGAYQETWPMDVYVWDGGISTEPGEVLCLVPDVSGMEIPFWPSCGETQVEIGCTVGGEFTVGYWTDFSGYEHREWYMCADENGPGGHPWTCIAPGIGYPTGWQHCNVAFGGCISHAIGIFFPADAASVDEFPEDGQPVESPTWGQIKAIFGE